MDTLLMLNLCTVEELRMTSTYLEDFLRDNVPTFGTLDSKDSIDNIIDAAVFAYIVSDGSDSIILNATMDVLDEVEQELRAKGCVPIYGSSREGNEDGTILYGETYKYLEDYIRESITQILNNDRLEEIY